MRDGDQKISRICLRAAYIIATVYLFGDALMDIKARIRNFTACNTAFDKKLLCFKKSLDEISNILPPCKKKKKKCKR